MKKLTILIACLFTMQFGFAQAFEKGDFLISAGFGAGGFETEAELQLGDVIFPVETDGAFGYHFPISIEYGISNFISLGLLVQPVTYIDDDEEDDQWNEDVPGNSLSLLVSFHLLDNDKSDLTGNISFGRSTLIFPESDDNSKLEWAGPNFKASMGYRRYFGVGKIGIFTTLGYARYNFEIQEFVIEGQVIDLDDVQYRFDFSGVEWNAGLTVKL